MIRVDLEQGSAAWELWRRGGLGASDARVVAGERHFRDEGPLALFRDRARGIGRPDNFAMRRGRRLEPVVRGMYERLERCRVDVFCAEHSERRWLRSSLDGVCSRTGQAERWLIEIKAPCWLDHQTALAGHVPEHYRPQCQQTLYVSGLDRLDYVSFSDKDGIDPACRLAIVPGVAPDVEWIAWYLPRAERFWARVLGWRDRVRRVKVAAAAAAAATSSPADLDFW